MPKLEMFEEDEPESEPELNSDSDIDDDDEEDQEYGVETKKLKDQRKKIGGQIAAAAENNVDDEDSDIQDDEDIEEEEDEDLEDEAEELEDNENNQEGGEGDEDEEEEEEIDEQNSYNKYFNEKLTKDYIAEIHPECIPVNMVEVDALLNVVRDEHGIIIDDFHKTLPFITKYEKTRIIGQRASQLDSGATPYIIVPPNVIDSSVIAEMEFNQKKIPSIIKRPLPNGSFEYWRLSDLEILI
jgi:DNA-directed RNA polymerase subunit K/omega